MIARIFAIVLVVVLIAACSSSGSYKATGPSSAMQASYESIKLVFRTTATHSEDIVPDMQAAIVGQLLSMGRYKRVVAASDAADLVLTLEITDYRRVGVAERVFIGAMAGPNRLTVIVSATDGRTGAVLRQFQATGESASHPLSGESGYSDALREVAKQIQLALTT